MADMEELFGSDADSEAEQKGAAVGCSVAALPPEALRQSRAERGASVGLSPGGGGVPPAGSLLFTGEKWLLVS